MEVSGQGSEGRNSCYLQESDLVEIEYRSSLTKAIGPIDIAYNPAISLSVCKRCLPRLPFYRVQTWVSSKQGMARNRLDHISELLCSQIIIRQPELHYDCVGPQPTLV